MHARLCRDVGGEGVGRAAGQLLGLDAERVRTRGGDGEVRRERELLQAHEARAFVGRGMDAAREQIPMLAQASACQRSCTSAMRNGARAGSCIRARETGTSYAVSSS